MSDNALSVFLAYSRELERESEERYSELAAAMAAHNNREVATFFENMAREARLHLEEVLQLCASRELPVLDPWEFQWPEAEAPETASYEALHYLMSLGEAMQLALRNERAAGRFYCEYGERSEDATVKRIAAQFAEEEAEHARALELLLEGFADARKYTHEDDDPPHMPE